MPRKVRRTRLALLFVFIAAAAFSGVKFVSYAQKKAPAAPTAPTVTATETLTDPVLPLTSNNGDGKAQPGETLLATVTITNTGSDATAVSLADSPGNFLSPKGANGTFAIGPIAGSDTYETIGNTQLEVSGAQTIGTGVFVSGNVLSNDSDPVGNTFSITAFDAASTLNGTVSMNTGTGTFTYTPPAGTSTTVDTADTFTYTITDSGGLSSVGKVTINIRKERIWYVKNNVGVTTGLGRSTDPFDTLAKAATASAAGDTIYVFNGDGTTAGQTTGITLKLNQVLIGEGVALIAPATVNGTTPTLRAAGTKPQISNATAASDAVTLNDGNTVKGLTITGATRDGIAGSTHASFTADTLTVQNNTGSGLHFTSMTGNLTLTNATITGNAIQLDVNNGTGTVALNNSNSITAGAGKRSVSIQNRPLSAGSITIGAGITDNGTGILVSNNASGTITFNGAQTLTTTTNTAVNLATNTGVTITFSGTLGITTTTGTGFAATGGGTLTVTGTANITTGAAPSGLSVNGMTIGPSGVTFNSVNTTGAATGISLVNFVTAGTVSVNGGTITNGAGTTGISMQGANTSLSLANVTITGGSGSTVGIANTTNFGTLTIGASVNVSAATALNLTTGTLSGTFATLTASGGTNGVSLTTISGTSAATAGTLSGSSGTEFLASGGTGTFTYPGAITQTTAATVVDIQNKTSGGATFNGLITSSNGTGRGINLVSNGTSTFSFTGGLTLSTAGNPAFTATGGGTASVTGAANTLTTTTGTALNVTDTIGASGLTFLSISANGATNGIILNNTGASGGLTVTGTSTTAGSGGTIQNNVQGALFTSTSNLSLSNMNFTNADSGNGTVNNVDTSTFNSAAQAAINMSSVTTATFTNLNVTGGGGAGGAQVGINGQNLSNLTLSNSTISGFGDAAAEGDVKLWNVTGTSSVTNSNFSFVNGDTTGGENLFEIRNNTSASLTLTLTGNTFSNTFSSASGSGGFAITSTSSGTVNVTAVHNTFSNMKTSGIEAFAKQTSTMNIDITGQGVDANGNTFTPAAAPGSRAIGLNSQDTAHLNFNVNHNTHIQGFGGPIVNIYAQDAANIQGHIDNNPDMQNTQPGSAGSPIFIHPQDNATGIVEVSGNTIINKGNNDGISAQIHGDGISRFSAALDLTIASNTINMQGTNSFGILLSSGAANTDATTLTANIHNNAVTLGGSGNTGFGIENTGGSASHLYLENFVTDANATWNASSNTPANSTAELDNTPPAPLPSAIPAGHNGGHTKTPTNPIALVRPSPDRMDDLALNSTAEPYYTELFASADSASLDYPKSFTLGERARAEYEPALNVLGDTAQAEIVNSEQPTVNSVSTEDKPSLIAELYDKLTSSMEPTVEAQSGPTSGTVTTSPTFTLPAGSSVTITYQLTVGDGPYPAGLNNLTDAASVSGSNFTTVVANPAGSIQLIASPSISVANSDSATETTPGATIVYPVVATNASIPSGQDATGVVLTETVPANTTFNPGASSAGWTCVPNGSAGSTCTNTVGALSAQSGVNTVTKNFAVDVTGPLAATVLSVGDTASVADDGTNGANQVSPANTSDTDTVRGTWVGGTSNDFTIAANWVNALAPNSGQNISIPTGGGANSPSVLTGTVVTNKVFFSGKSLTIASGANLTANTSVSLGSDKVLGAGTLEIGNGGTITFTTGWVQCALKKDFLNGLLTEGPEGAVDPNVAPNAPPPTVFTYPVGTAAGMFEVQVTPTVTSGGSLTIQNFDGNPAPTGAGTTLQRFWTTSSGGGITADVKFFYHATATPGAVGSYRELRVVPVNQVQSFPNGAPCPGTGSPCVDNTAKTIFVAGASSFNANWTAGEPLGTTAAMVGISGRVLTADGIALRGVRVTLDDGTGHPISATSNAFGYYHFDAVQS
ncbi:MAG: beta strand repeat-containing protein, partial [Pyrinomonadaceae bacterium]